MVLTFFVNFNFRESFDKQTDFGHDEANTDIISGDTNPGDNDEAMDEEVLEDTIEETLEENDVVLDGLSNDTMEETLEENNVHNDSIVMKECKYCEDAIPNKRFKAHAGNFWEYITFDLVFYYKICKIAHFFVDF